MLHLCGNLQQRGTLGQISHFYLQLIYSPIMALLLNMVLVLPKTSITILAVVITHQLILAYRTTNFRPASTATRINTKGKCSRVRLLTTTLESLKEATKLPITQTNPTKHKLVGASFSSHDSQSTTRLTLHHKSHSRCIPLSIQFYNRTTNIKLRKASLQIIAVFLVIASWDQILKTILMSFGRTDQINFHL